MIANFCVVFRSLLATKYKVSFKLANVQYTEELASYDSAVYQNYAGKILTAVSKHQEIMNNDSNSIVKSQAFSNKKLAKLIGLLGDYVFCDDNGNNEMA